MKMMNSAPICLNSDNKIMIDLSITSKCSIFRDTKIVTLASERHSNEFSSFMVSNLEMLES